MAPWFSKTLKLLSKKTSSPFYIPSPPYSLSLFFFSTSSPRNTASRITIFDYLVNHQQFSPQSASTVASSTVKYLKKPQNADSVLNFLEESGFSKARIENIVHRMPKVLSANFEKIIKPKIKMFQDLGFETSDFVEIISADPWILTRSANNRLRPSILVLMNVFGSVANVSELLKISGWFLKKDLERAMLPNIEYLKSCGISLSQIVKYVYNFPRFCLIKPEGMKDIVKRVDEMGVDRKSKSFLAAVRVLCSMTRENWELKLKLFRELGLSEEDILSVFRRVPSSFAVSQSKIKEVTQLLLSVEDIDISYIVLHPDLLICSAKQRIKPRLEVIKVLENKNLLKKRPSLTTICKISNVRFVHKFVIPYSNEFRDLKMTSHLVTNNITDPKLVEGR